MMSVHTRIVGRFILLACMTAAQAGAADPPPIAHRIMVCEYSNAAHRLIEISPDGKPLWEHKFPSVAVCFRMAEGGNVLFADGGSPTGVQEVNRDHLIEASADWEAPSAYR